MRIRGQGRLKKYIAKKISKYSRKNFLKKVLKGKLFDSQNEYPHFNARIFSFSGYNYYNEQLYSILKFLSTVGKPTEWIVVNDGTFKSEQIEQLQRFSFVKVVNFDWIENPNFHLLKEFSKKHVWAKIFYSYLCLLDDLMQTTIYLEADVLVFQKFNYYLPLFKENNWYLPDTGPHFDQYFLDAGKVQMFDVNNGFAIYNQRPDIDILYNYLVESFKENRFEYFTPQSAMQLMIEKDKHARFLDPRYFVVSCSDHFKVGIDYNESNLALRHFVGPVRHKMWQYSWKNLRVN